MITLKSIFFVAFAIILCACNESQYSDLQIISVDLESRDVIPLSEITQEVKEIRLELTDESLLSDQITRVLYSDECLFILDRKTPVPMMFDCEGKYIHSIGRNGQGPGEFTHIMDIAADFKNKYLYVMTSYKLLVYNFEGEFIKERKHTDVFTKYITYADNSLKMIYEKRMSEPKRMVSGMYSLNAQLEIKDSLHLKTYLNPRMVWVHAYNDYITESVGTLYQYYYELNPEPSLRDTLFCMKGNECVPSLKLDFGTSGVDMEGERILYLFNIYRSERFVFTHYGVPPERYMHSCHDLKTGKEYHMEEGFEDDIHHSGKVIIRPINTNSELYYYFYQDENLDEDDNPVLCIGTLKK